MFSTNVSVLVASVESIDVVSVSRHSTSSFAFLIQKVKECAGVVDVTRKAHSTADDGNRFVRGGSIWVARVLCSSVRCAVDIWDRVVLAEPIGCKRSEVGCHGDASPKDASPKMDASETFVYMMGPTTYKNTPLVLLRMGRHHLLSWPCQKTNGHSNSSHAYTLQYGLTTRCTHAMHMACSCTCLQAWPQRKVKTTYLLLVRAPAFIVRQPLEGHSSKPRL
jgi:hypothetical protein